MKTVEFFREEVFIFGATFSGLTLSARFDKVTAIIDECDIEAAWQRHVIVIVAGLRHFVCNPGQNIEA